MIGILGIMIILLAVLALVVKALVGSPWGMFTIADDSYCYFNGSIYALH